MRARLPSLLATARAGIPTLATLSCGEDGDAEARSGGRERRTGIDNSGPERARETCP